MQRISSPLPLWVDQISNPTWSNPPVGYKSDGQPQKLLKGSSKFSPVIVINENMDDPDSAKASVEKLTRLPINWVYPGHGRLFAFEQLLITL